MDTPPAPPDLPDDAHKGDAGRVLALVGSRDMPGAATLAARAAMRAGAGLVTLGVTDRSLIAAVAPAAPEAIFVVLDGERFERGRLPLALRDARADVRLVGCGRGNDDTTRALVRALVDDTFDGPLVVDADGLNAVSGEPERLATARGVVVITPHPGEAARLLARPVGASEVERVLAAEELARRVRGVAVLKGKGTVVSDGARTWIATTGNSGMATAGAGDVLAGILAAYLCAPQRFPGYSVWDAVRAAVHVHGLAGDLAAAAVGRRALVASDLIAHLPAAQEAHRAAREPWAARALGGASN
ncbi:MAG: NAD(P)H-hydrate dehydratase [Planctomycetota bacterium]